ncbi:MAG: hypothetical protein HN849_34760, partial [Victivallales bacterium]|nr:hypothetical protein [Victivallales bacterium]
MHKTPDYRPVTPEIARRLEAIVGPRNVVYGDPERLEPYSHDEVADAHCA